MLGLIFSISALTALAGQEPQPLEIVVEGSGVIERAPDRVTIRVELESDAETIQAALERGEQLMSSVREAVLSLDEINTLTLTTVSAFTSELMPPHCERHQYARRAECVVIGYRFSRDVSLDVDPAEAAGPALSILSEVGANAVSLERFSLNDPADAQRAADAAAFDDARAKAGRLAAAMGAELGPVTRLQAGSGFRTQDLFAGDYEDRVVVTGSRVASPRVRVSFEVEPVTVQSTIVVAFEILAD